jgi:hypothetical protein
MDPISIALSLAPLVPGVVRWITGDDKSAKVAEKVVDVAKAVTGIPEPEEAVRAIHADPALALRFQETIAAMEADLEKAYLADRKSARDRDIEMIRAGKHNWRADILAFLSISGLVICVWFVARDTAMPERAVNAIMFVAGVLASAVRDVFAFEFGSSRGSKEKDEMMKHMTISK